MLYHNGLTLKVDYFTWVLLESARCPVGPPVHWNSIRPAAHTLSGPQQIHRLTLLPFEGIEITTSPLEGSGSGSIVHPSCCSTISPLQRFFLLKMCGFEAFVLWKLKLHEKLKAIWTNSSITFGKEQTV